MLEEIPSTGIHVVLQEPWLVPTKMSVRKEQAWLLGLWLPVSLETAVSLPHPLWCHPPCWEAAKGLSPKADSMRPLHPGRLASKL